MLFNGVDINEGDKVKVSFTDTVSSIFTAYGERGVDLELESEGFIFTDKDVQRTYPDFTIAVVERAFPQFASSIISKVSGRFANETRYVLNEKEQWVDLSTNVAYSVVDLGDREDYEVVYLAEEY
jgi:hypothetical protein